MKTITRLRKIKRKAVCIYGNPFKEDFVLEPACSDDCKCSVCKNNTYWIEIEKIKLPKRKLSKKEIKTLYNKGKSLLKEKK